MDNAVLRMKDLPAFVEAVRRGAALFAPTADGKGGTAFAAIREAGQADLFSPNTRLSVKGLFFPQREPLMGFSRGALEEIPAPDRPFVVLGARPCDARSLTWLDAVFGGKPLAGAAAGAVDAAREDQPSPPDRPRDPYYLARRAGATVIALACDHPCASCFCTSVGGGPYGSEGADISASFDGQGGEQSLLLEARTVKGAELLAAHAALLSAPDADAESRRAARKKKAEAVMKPLDFSGIAGKLDRGWDSPLWDRMTRTCIGCGACTYLCPTCHCFDISDETQGERGIRLRTWDSCQYAQFTQHASGHNPRTSRKARMRQRIMHKYCYAPQTAGSVFCSGCGRCVRACPVNLDIRQMLASLKELP